MSAAPYRRIRPTSITRDGQSKQLPELEIVRGAPASLLDQPSGAVFDNIPWNGADPDPDVLGSKLFLEWLR